MIRLSRKSMEEAFVKYLETVFEHPEIIRASVRNIVINRENTEDAEKRAFEAGFHDCFSDIDLAVKVCLPSDVCLEDAIMLIETDEETGNRPLSPAY